MLYTVLRLDKTQPSVRFPEDSVAALKAGQSYTLTIKGEQVCCKYAGNSTFVEDLPIPPAKEWIALALMVSALVAVLGLAAWDIQSNVGNAPDAPVIAAVADAGISGATVEASEYSVFSGCDRSDTRAYPVFKDGRKIGVVCRGGRNHLPGFPTKGSVFRRL